MRSRTRLAAGLAVLVTGLTAASANAATAPLPGNTDVPPVHAKAETTPLFDDDAGHNSNADDPAVWYNSARPGSSLVLGTAKEGGLDVYGLDGHPVQTLPAPTVPAGSSAPSRFNNVDLLPGLRFPDGHRSDVAVVTDRGRDRIRFYRIDGSNPAAPLSDVTDTAVPRAFSANEADVDDQFTAYGTAAWQDPRTGRSYVLASRRHTAEVGLFEITVTSTGTVTYHKVRGLTLPSTFRTPGGTWTPCEDPGAGPQAEGMVVDTASGTVYIGQEDVGVWKMSANLTGSPRLVDRTTQFGVSAVYDPAADECVAGADPGYGGRHLTADTEGLTLFRAPSGHQYLIASSQGDYTYSVYDTSHGDRWTGAFRVAAGTSVDGTEETDGIAALDRPLGSAFPHGVFVVQDGYNAPAPGAADDGDRTDTNYKIVDLSEVMRAAGVR
ncbi:phytase [Streptomyces sp. NBC_00669]|uniref:phytase n=1 Tax=Streptomyces sp. NBC_00669 TaxID=2976011 RepID=UPI002E2EDECF|nr:phytase [Streptomyces sp. NBC_00669]